MPNPRLTRLNKVTLWVAMAVVLAFGLFPNYVGVLLGGSAGGAIARAATTDDARHFRIDGMTCEACAVTLRARLAGVPGVARAGVNFVAKTATVYVAPDGPAPSDAALLQAIAAAGYHGERIVSERVVHIDVAIHGPANAGEAP